MTAKRMKATAKLDPLLHLSRFANTKQESDRQLKDMKAAGIRDIQQSEHRSLWRLRGCGTRTELLAFIATEAKREGESR